MPEEKVETEEVKETEIKISEEEKETPEESSTEEKPAEEEQSSEGEDANEELAKAQELKSQIEGLQVEKTKLLEDIVGLRGERRTIKQEEINKVEAKIDELKDINPDDVAVIEKIVKQKGFMTETQFNERLYSQTQQEELDGFLEKYPEFKPENDPTDKNWKALKNALADYSISRDVPLPDFRQKVKRVFEKARRDITPISGQDTSEAKKQQLRTAAIGGKGGVKSPSTSTRFSADQLEHYRRGGFTEAEIAEMQNS